MKIFSTSLQRILWRSCEQKRPLSCSELRSSSSELPGRALCTVAAELELLVQRLEMLCKVLARAARASRAQLHEQLERAAAEQLEVPQPHAEVPLEPRAVVARELEPPQPCSSSELGEQRNLRLDSKAAAARATARSSCDKLAALAPARASSRQLELIADRAAAARARASSQQIELQHELAAAREAALSSSSSELAPPELAADRVATGARSRSSLRLELARTRGGEWSSSSSELALTGARARASSHPARASEGRARRAAARASVAPLRRGRSGRATPLEDGSPRRRGSKCRPEKERQRGATRPEEEGRTGSDTDREEEGRTGATPTGNAQSRRSEESRRVSRVGAAGEMGRRRKRKNEASADERSDEHARRRRTSIRETQMIMPLSVDELIGTLQSYEVEQINDEEDPKDSEEDMDDEELALMIKKFIRLNRKGRRFNWKKQGLQNFQKKPIEEAETNRDVFV
ncbi:uncharacterized protein LOC120293995 [Eucalyptus grandis]|uniref:uncharacterized protein LOC120293995 n=1 Tax=Eucalyptus grandis TaxID=71139 RepID=UPI00192EE49D|nr:uncharacterized protein LOC120293995 [Eucalyptus grandis]